jgi:LPXTG-site transpeptidase (sortase) family protein
MPKKKKQNTTDVTSSSTTTANKKDQKMSKKDVSKTKAGEKDHKSKSSKKNKKLIQVKIESLDEQSKTEATTPLDHISAIDLEPLKLITKPKKKNQKALTIFFALVFLVGLNMVILGVVYQQYRRTVLSFKASPVTTLELTHRRGEPLSIDIPNLKISLPVQEAAIKDGIWETSDKNITHLDTSARPGERGNVVLYGHNRRNIFMNLHNIKVGDVLKVATKEGKIYEYTVTETQRVKPEHIEAVLPTDYEVLTVYTCIGFLDSERFVVKAKPTQVTSW